MSYFIRPCEPGDIWACAELYAEIYREAVYAESWTSEEASAYLDRFYRIEPGDCRVAEAESRVVGAIFGYSYPWLGRKCYFVQELFVHGDQRRRGIATALFRSLLDRSTPGATVCLIANERAPAVELYARLGLKQHQDYKFYCGFLSA